MDFKLDWNKDKSKLLKVKISEKNNLLSVIIRLDRIIQILKRWDSLLIFV